MAKTKKKAAKKSGKQLRIAGTERIDGIKEVDEAAAAYVKVRDKRMELTKTEKEQKTVLMSLVKKHGLSTYIYEDEDGEQYDVEYETATDENVTVRKHKSAAADKDDE